MDGSDQLQLWIDIQRMGIKHPALLNQLMAKKVQSQRNSYERGDANDAGLNLFGADGLYNPITNNTTIRSKMDLEGHQNTVAHENEHKRQYNARGDLNSENAIRIAEGISKGALEKMGYSRADLPYEVLAFMAGVKGKDHPNGPNLPHPAWNELSPEAKAWYLSHQTGPVENNALNRIRNGAGNFGNKVMRPFQLLKQAMP
jgi:hypothetical protein